MKGLCKDETKLFIEMWNNGIDLFKNEVPNFNSEQEIRSLAYQIFGDVFNYFNLPSLLNDCIAISMHNNYCVVMTANEALEAFEDIGGMVARDATDSDAYRSAITTYVRSLIRFAKASKSEAEDTFERMHWFVNTYIDEHYVLLFASALLTKAYHIRRQSAINVSNRLSAVDMLNNAMDIVNQDAQTISDFVSDYNKMAPRHKKINWNDIAQKLGARP